MSFTETNLARRCFSRAPAISCLAFEDEGNSALKQTCGALSHSNCFLTYLHLHGISTGGTAPPWATKSTGLKIHTPVQPGVSLTHAVNGSFKDFKSARRPAESGRPEPIADATVARRLVSAPKRRSRVAA